jgi:putative membrane protein
MVNCPLEYGGGYGMMGSGMMGSGWPIVGWVFMVLFWAALILLVIWLYKQVRGPDTETKDIREAPLDVLKKRYARGEISREEFTERKKDIE